MLNRNTQKILFTLLGVAVVSSFVPSTLAKAEEVTKGQVVQDKNVQSESKKIQKSLQEEVKNSQAESDNSKIEQRTVLNGEKAEIKDTGEEKIEVISKDEEEPKLYTGGLEKAKNTVLSEEEASKIPTYDASQSAQAKKRSFSLQADNEKLYNTRYAYNALGNLANGENLQKAYDDIYQYLLRVYKDAINIDSTLVGGNYCLQKINISDYKLKYDSNYRKDDAQKVLDSIRFDNPEFFWLARNINKTLDKSGTYVTTFAPVVDEPYKSRKSRSDMKAKITEAIKDFLSDINYSNDYDTELAIQKKIVDTTIYDPKVAADGNDPGSVNAHNIAGVLVDRVAVCESYAKTVQLLLNAKNIENIYVVGSAQGGGHAWNQVKINGNYYNLDVTWDDTNKTDFDGIKYDYFNLEDLYFKKCHEANKPDLSTGVKEYLYPTVACEKDDNSYYSKNTSMVYDDSDMTTFLAKKIKNVLNQGSYEIRLACKTDAIAQTMKNYFKNKTVQILQSDTELLNLYSNKCSDGYYIQGGDGKGDREIRIRFIPKQIKSINGISIPSNLTFDALNKSYHIIPQVNPTDTTEKDNIQWTSNNTRVAIVNNTIDPSTKVNPKGTVTSVGPGTATITASTKDGTIKASCLVTVNVPNVSLQQEIPVTSVSISPEIVTLNGIGSMKQLTATCSPLSATNSNVTWESSDDTIVTVDRNGKLTAVKAGTATISCSAIEKGNSTTPVTTSSSVTVNEEVGTVDSRELQKLYYDHQHDTQGNYTTESWNAFTAALTDAKTVLDNASATQNDVDTAKSKLQTAINKLVANAEEAVSKAELQTLYDTHKADAQGNYTEESWNAFTKALTGAKTVLDKANATQSDVDKAESDLKAAISGLAKNAEQTVSKAELQKLYYDHKADTQGNYTQKSWNEFKTALTDAKTLLDNASATQDDVDTAKNKLQTAISGLVSNAQQTVSKAGLQTLYDAHKADTQGNYTTTSWNEFTKALTGAKTVLDKANTTQSDVDKAESDLKAAINRLVKNGQETVSKTELQKLYDGHKADTQGNYTQESWNAFTNALTGAKTVLDNASATQNNVDTAKSKLQAAISGLAVNGQARVASITITGNNVITTKGGTLTLTANVFPSNAANKSVTWSSSNNSIASVSDQGLVTAKADGVVTITATSNDGSKIAGTKVIAISGQTSTTPAIPTKPTKGSDSVIKIVSISGTEEVRHTIKVKIKHEGENASFEYKWQRSSKKYGEYVDIVGETGDEYKLKSSDKNKYIKVIVTATINGKTYTSEEITSKIDKNSSSDDDHDDNWSDTSLELSNSNSNDNTINNSNNNGVLRPSTQTNTSSSGMGPIMPTNESPKGAGILIANSSSIIDGHFTDPSGRAVRGWIKSNNGKWYYLNNNGIAQVGWLQDNGKWYYLSPTTDTNRAIMKTGWVQDNGKWYYLDLSGAMVSNTTIDGYKIDSDGAML